MKKTINYLAALCAVVWSVSFVSCSDDNDPKDPVVNHIYLSVPDGAASIIDGTDEAITVSVNLSQAVVAAETFTFAIEGENADQFVISDNPVTIAAGASTGFFTVKSANKLTIDQDVTATFSITGLDASKFDITSNVTITLKPAEGSASLDPAAKALIAAWKEKYGVDIMPWIGNVRMQGTLEFPGGGYLDPFVAPETITLGGYTAFGISDLATEEVPALDMVENPMGMTDYLYKSFRNQTIDDKEFFALEDDGNGLELMELLNWNANSDETFSVVLKGIKITSIANGKATLDFVVEGPDYIYNSKGETIYDEMLESDFVYNDSESRIPFVYTYTAWERQLGLIESGDAAATELLAYGLSAAPAHYLGVSSVLEDAWEIDEDEDDAINLYVEPKGEIDFNAGTMTFEFPFDHADQYGYSRVKVVYTLEK